MSVRGEEDSEEAWERTTLGKLAEWQPPPDNIEEFHRLIEVLDKYYPPNWRAWEIYETSYEDLFGPTISSDDECRLRFAIPTVEFSYIFGGSSTGALSVRKYNYFKKTLLNWPLGRAIIYCPLATMKKVHPVDAFNEFASFLPKIKPHLISRNEAEKLLKNQLDSSSEPLSSQNKREHSPDQDTPKRRKTEDREDLVLSLMKQQNEMLQSLFKLQAANSATVNAKTNENKTDDNWAAPSFTEDEPDHPGNVLDSSSDSSGEESENEELLLDFAPETKESEGKLSAAKEDLVNQGIQCQRLGLDSWQNIRYADVQKKFQATPVFTNLKVNSSLATVTPPWQLVSILEKMDLCLGAISHGLLQQRKEFQEIYQNSSLETKKSISKNFLSSESSFRKTSDTMLQYVCGKRAEIIQQRRSLYKPPNKVLNELLHAIPPSSSHLFAEPQLSDLIKDQGGISKLFPTKNKFKSKRSKESLFRKEVKEKFRQTDQHKRPKFRFGEKTPSFRTGKQRYTNKQTKSNPEAKKF